MANSENLDLKRLDEPKSTTNFNHQIYYQNNFDKIDAAVGAKPTDLTTTAKTIIPAINELKSDKVDKVAGKGLSTNDFDNTYKQKIDVDIPAQLNEKVQNFKLKNEVVNGDFSQGTTGWVSYNATINNVNGELNAEPNAGFGQAFQLLKTIVGDKYYMRAKVKANVNNVVILFASVTSSAHSGNGQYQQLSLIASAETTANPLIILDVTPTASIPFTADDVVVINLTKTFGVGNEPSKLEMDELMKVIPNGWWDGELSLTQKQFITWQLNLIRKNTNAIIALGGTII